MTRVDVRRAGDRAVLLEVDDNPAALRLARWLRENRDDLVDVVPGHRTVLVTWAGDSRQLDVAALAAAAGADDAAAEGAFVEIPVSYDGADLEDVARFTGLSPEEVVARHAAPVYRAAFLGFQPGFAYLLGLDDRLVVPRLNEPRTRVPPGAVAIAGPYTGVYPRESPGGWRLLGRTPAAMFDSARATPALLAAGDVVRFVHA